MRRIPEEPAFDGGEKRPSAAATQASDGDEGDGDDGQVTDRPSAVSWPNALDFNELQSTKSAKECNAICLEHMRDMARAGLRLTDAELTAMDPLPHERVGRVPVRVETASVVGVPFDDLKCVRHTAEIDINAEIVFDAYVRLNYAEAIDRYAYLVEVLEDIETGGQFSWAHVAYTADRIMPFFAHRDFVTLDFVDEANLMLVSRSCSHPERPQTAVPTFLDCVLGVFFNKPTRTLRSPLCYVLRVIPLGERKCRIVQFQYSDMGGIIPPAEQTKAVVKFGLVNLDSFYQLVKKTQDKGLEVGPGAADYLSDPLSRGWRKGVGEMIPGL